MLEWEECPPDAGFDPHQECASLTVPLDYDDPDGETIDIAVSQLLTADPAQRRGILLENPGGPGTAGIYDPAELAARLPQSVLDRYDLVCFDPRGLHFSAPVSCALEPEDLDVPDPRPRRGQHLAVRVLDLRSRPGGRDRTPERWQDAARAERS